MRDEAKLEIATFLSSKLPRDKLLLTLQCGAGSVRGFREYSAGADELCGVE
jgi:hypothetical protein